MSYKSERSFERSMIPHEYIEELTRRTDIVELVGSYVQLKRKGRLYGGLCPFHSEKTPSFYVYPDWQRGPVCRSRRRTTKQAGCAAASSP